MTTSDLLLSVIRTDGGTQPRAGLDSHVADEYMGLMKDGVEFPPVVVFHDGENYWLADGFHRHKAVELAGLQQITADVRLGTLDDARWFSFAANKANGLRRSNEDKQRAVKAALKHPKSAEMSNSAIAKHVGVDEGTVRGWREKLAATSEIPKCEKRTGADGRTINIANIGKRAEPAPTEGLPAQSAPAEEAVMDFVPAEQPAAVEPTPQGETATLVSIEEPHAPTEEIAASVPAEETVVEPEAAEEVESQPAREPAAPPAHADTQATTATVPTKPPARAITSKRKRADPLPQLTVDFIQASKHFVELTERLAEGGQPEAARKHLEDGLAFLAASTKDIEKARTRRLKMA